MRINHIQVKQFRNFTNQAFLFDANTNIFIGKNAQGKTNLIEAIYLLSLAKSFRTRINQEMIKFDCEFALIKGEVESYHQVKDLELIFSTEGKKAKIDQIIINKTTDFVGNLNVVVFTPDDLSLIKGSPKERRKFIDIELSKISPIYLFSFNKYNYLLKERNKYLKVLNGKGKKEDEYLEVLSEQMADLQVDLIHKRNEFIQKLNLYANKMYQFVSDNNEKLEITYSSHYEIEHEHLYQYINERYKKTYSRDIRYMQTQEGIHKDDLKVILNDKNAQTYASQGQQRTIVLAMKIALLELIKDSIGEYPILLLDDVLSELDDIRKTKLLNLIDDKIQTFITTTSIEGIQHEVVNKAKKFVLVNGKLQGGNVDG